MLKIIGECNLCGACCQSGCASCENLIVIGNPGEENATKCAVYETRYHRMPMRQLWPDGTVKRESVCIMFEEFIKEGGSLTLPPECSLKIVED